MGNNKTKQQRDLQRTHGHQWYQRMATFFGKIFSTTLNPLYHLGGITVLMFLIACISGIYIFIFYNINPRHAWDSVEAISNNYFNGWMRTIHRYSSDLLIIFILLHLAHTLFTSKFKRLVSWISGIISFLLVILIGVTGFMLVWDQKAKLAGYLTAKLFSSLPIFDPSIAGAFLMNDLNTVGGFFKVALFGHIAFSLITVIVIWIHVLRISKPKIFPPKKLILYASIALAIISIVFPIKSDLPAQVSNLPIQTTFDWYYYFGYYLMKLFSVNQNWMILIGSGLLLCIIPYVIKRKNNPPVHIDLDKCDACNLCAYDCPYEAIDMLTVKGERKAILSPDKCVGCTICIGSCDEHAITHPQFPQLAFLAQDKADVTLFSCSYFPEPELPDELKTVHYRVPCTGSVMPKDVQKILENNSEKVAILSCEDCYYRLGKTWTLQRFLRKRAPLFSKKYDASKVKLITLTQYSKDKLMAFSKEKIDNGHNHFGKLNVADHQKSKPVLSVLILTALFALMIPLSSTTVRFFNPKEKTLIVNFKYISTPQEYEQSSGGAVHMQAKTPVVKRRSPVMLKVFSSKDRALIFEKEYKPRGLRQDIAMFIFSQLVVQADAVDVELFEKAFPEKNYQIRNVTLKEGDGTFVVFKDGKLVVGNGE
ncbi:MAG TPA: cytochrome b N-terminal domain-containing protein [Niabella sp.]|nr:cytochrome b N-terminal domain-containing protein [Niabella sp.]HOZ96498.1 cytochrome b N-terminal domain-containing protein [Niabella sp.]HQW13321.1 cytochrome b N-terminal domain-containing protein [Niabella sp.]HQX18639.1 cytochrome b N-terminal domain-containing protein [Niabella sp.]HQX40292.1 cytochrome b N-terminal domain-containing protein [Niabella sp.]